MYIVAIAWLYVALMMAITEKSVTAGVLTFVFFGLAPCALVLWLFGGPTRKRQRQLAAERDADAATTEEPTSVPVSAQDVNERDGTDAQPDQRKLGE
jgi:hypothetical protein